MKILDIPERNLLRIVLIVFSVFYRIFAVENDAKWKLLDTMDEQLQNLESQLQLYEIAIKTCKEMSNSEAIKSAYNEIKSAEEEIQKILKEEGLFELHEKLQKARIARDSKVEELLVDAPTYHSAKNRQKELQQKITEMKENINSLTFDEILKLAELIREEKDLSKRLAGAIRAWWLRGEVAKEYAIADEAYHAYNNSCSKSTRLQEANNKLKKANQALSEAIDKAELTLPVHKELENKKIELEGKISELKTKISELEKTLLASKTYTIVNKEVNPKTKQEEEKKVSLWLPANHDYIYGVIIAHPMLKSLATDKIFLREAARVGCGTMVFDQFARNPKESLERIDRVLEKFAEETKHPELKGAPLLLGGLSASVLCTRDIACIAPERVFGIVHVAGGNLQEMPDGGKGMIEVPFIAHNGEFEWCGPAGGGHASGKAGIRPQYGNQTQWVMIREQMLRLWRNTYNHRMSLIVIPNADHGAWDKKLTALFIRKAFQYRVPKEKRDGSIPAVCLPLPVSNGWLTDADLDHPQYEPAPYDSYKGDKNNAFWHFDEEMAKAVYEFHKGKFILPDPTKKFPVPADWPAKDK